uniref:DUF4939 domain-containing protein n=1 Tax=Crocodylus porosus TaxID=8502 RepID=A0A7M4EQI3_CROPO
KVKEVFVLLNKVLVKSHLEYCNQFLHSQVYWLCSKVATHQRPHLEPCLPIPLLERYDHDWLCFWGLCIQYPVMVSLVVSLLMGDALNWAMPLVECNCLVLQNYVAFLQEFIIMFGDLHPTWKRDKEESQKSQKER